MRFHLVVILGLLIVCLSATVWGADKGEGARLHEEFITQLQFPTNSFNLDRQLRKELDKILPRLKVTGKGRLIKLEGDYAKAASEEEFLRYSVTLASSVKKYLDETGGLSNEAFVATKKFNSGENSHKPNMVRIFLIPKKFRVEMIDFDRLPANQRVYRQTPEADITMPAEVHAGTPSPASIPSLPEPTAEEASAQKRIETERRSAEEQIREEAKQADEAVAKVKARALERAKRLTE